MMSLMSNTQKLQNLIDSDDELPYDYIEIADIPAYLNENRFEQIRFPWLEDYDIKNARIYKKKKRCTKIKYVDHVKSIKTLIKKGILDQEAIYCLKSVAALTNDDTMLLWFVDFLMYKDLQMDYKFLKSCLVTSIANFDDTNVFLSTIDSRKSKFEIVTKSYIEQKTESF